MSSLNLRNRPRRRWDELQSDASDSGYDVAEDNSDSDFAVETRKSSRPRKKKIKTEPKGPKPRTKATISLLATDTNPNEWSSDLSHIDSSVLAKIKKALALASHEGTGEQEAKAALRMASKWMSQYSVTQADVLATEDDAQRLKRAGMSVVSIVSLTESNVQMDTWALTAADAMGVFFDCKYYTHMFQGIRLQYHFYGLAEQTVTAAYAFEMVYNLVIDWSLRNKDAKSLRGKNLYRRGVADGLYRLARAEKKEEHTRAIKLEKKRLEDSKKAEEEENQRRLARLADPVLPEPSISESGPGSRDRKDKNATAGQSTSGKDSKVKIEELEDEDVLLPSVNIPQPKKEDDDSKDAVFLSERRDTGDDDVIDLTLLDDSSQEALPQADFNDSDDDNENILDFDVDALSAAGPSSLPLPTFAQPQVPGSLRLPSANLSSMGPPEPPAPQTAMKNEDEPAWRSAGQLIAFRETSVAIADEYLKKQDIKLAKGRSMPSLEVTGYEERRVYNQGREDAKKIDVKRRRIKNVDED